MFNETSMSQLTSKSRILTGYLELLLEESVASRVGEDKGKACCRATTVHVCPNFIAISGPHIEIITSSNPVYRGNQLSLQFSNCNLAAVHNYLSSHGVVVSMHKKYCIVLLTLICCRLIFENLI